MALADHRGCLFFHSKCLFCPLFVYLTCSSCTSLFWIPSFHLSGAHPRSRCGKVSPCFPTICFICTFTRNISCVYTDTNDWNESLVRMKMLHLSVSVGRFWPDTALLERNFTQEGAYADLYSSRHSSTQWLRSCLSAWEYCAYQKSTATKVLLGENYVFWNKKKKYTNEE